MDDKNTLERLKASYITLAEDYKMVKKKLPKAISVNNSTGLTYTILSFACALFVLLNSAISLSSEEAFADNEIISAYAMALEELPFNAYSLGSALGAVGIVIALTVIVSVIMRLRPSAKIKNEEKIEAPEDEAELFKRINYLCTIIPEECDKAKNAKLFMTLAPVLGTLAALAIALALTGALSSSAIVSTSLEAGTLIVIFLITGLILRAILFSKIKTIDVVSIGNRIREYENILTQTRNGIAAIEQAMIDMAAGNAEEAIRKIRYSASLKNKDGEAAAVAVNAMAELDPARMEINYNRLISLIGEGIQNKDVEGFCISTANTIKEKVEVFKKERFDKAMEKYHRALQIVDEKADYNAAIALCEDACYENISGALLLDLYCRLARTVTRLEESFILQSFNTLCKANDLSEKEQAIFGAIRSVIEPFLVRNFSITGNKNISATVKTNVRSIITSDSIEKSMASGKAALKNGDTESALKFFNIAASYKSVEAMSAYLAVSLIRDIKAGKKFTADEAANRKDTMEKTLRLNFSDKTIEELCHEAYDSICAYGGEINKVKEDDSAERKQYMTKLATALNKRVEDNKKSTAKEMSFGELFDFLMED